MLKDFAVLKFPELVVGIAGPIGIQIDDLCDTLKASLHRVGYESVVIHITDEIAAIDSETRRPRSQNFHSEIRYKMEHASSICRNADDAARLMRYAIEAIRRERAQSSAEMLPEDEASTARPDDVAEGSQVPLEDRVRQKLAYIIRQIKRPEEIDLLRSVYDRQFVLVSAYGPQEERRQIIQEQVKRTMPLTTKQARISGLVEDLITRDMDEGNDEHGQHLQDAFHRADVFVDGINKGPMEQNVARFINALFGLNEIAPTKTEYGMFMANSAAMRSSDLSRQVGAAIMAESGEILAQGCNEVPKAFGGTYWDTEEPDYRDVKLGTDPNDVFKLETVRDLVERLKDFGMLSEKAQKLGKSSQRIVDRLLEPTKTAEEDGSGCLQGALILDLTEYGRVVHAEMNAICDAARIGQPIKEAMLICTTFPCHNCTKHILTAGIKRVIYMEPYPKSRAKELHFNEIELEKDNPARVSFVPFLGIAPNRYRDIFSKGKRKSKGVANRWYYEEPCPMIDTLTPKYIEYEKYAISPLLGDISGSLNVVEP